MALDESGGYDLARGFDTLITGNKAIEQAIRDLQAGVMAALAMQRDTTMGASGRSPASMNPNVAAALAATQPSPTSGQTVAAPSVAAAAPGESRVAPQGVAPAPASQAPAVDPQAGSTTTKPQSQGPVMPNTPTADSGSGLLDSVLNILPFGDTISNAMSFGREQRDKNAQFQMIEGGSNWEGAASRASMKKYQMSTAAMFSGAEAEQAFTGVTALGYNRESGEQGEGPSRQDAANFLYKQKSATGMTVDEGLQHLDAFSKSASADLTSFSDALIGVGAAAKTAGRNAMEARANFTQLFGQANQAGFGMASTSFAQTMTNQQTGYSMAYQEGVDLSGTVSNQTVRLQSALQGKSMLQTTLASQSGVNTLAQGQVAGMKALIDFLPQDAVKWAKEQIAANPDMSTEDIPALGREMMRKMGYDPDSLLGAAQAFLGKNYNGNYELVMEEIIRYLMGQGVGAFMGGGGQLDEEAYGNLGLKEDGSTSATTEALKAGDNEGGAGASRAGTIEQVLNQMTGEEQDAQKVKIGGKEMLLSEAISDPKLRQKLTMGKGTLVGGEFDSKKVGEVALQGNEEAEGEDADTTATDTGVKVDVQINLSQQANEWFEADYNQAALPANS